MNFIPFVRNQLESLLSWLEQKSGLKMRHLINGWAWLFSGQVVGIATAVLLALGYSHFLSKETYGTYKYILSIFGILTVFTLPGMNDAAQRAIAQGKEGVFWKTFRKRLEWATLGGLVCAGIGIYYFLYGNTVLAAVFLAASPFIIFIDAFTQYNSLLMGRQLFRETSLYNAAVQIVASIIIFCAVLFSTNLITLIVAYLGAFVIARGIAFLYVTKRFPTNDIHDDSALPYGTHMSATIIINTSINQLDSILLWHFLGPVGLAVYSFAEAAADQGQKVFKLITTAMAFPKFSAAKKETLKRTLPRKILIAHLVTIPAAIALALVIPFVYTILFPQYVDSIPYAQVMALLLSFTPLRFLSTAINAKASTKAIYGLSIFGSSLQVVLLFISIPMWGIWGAIYATFIQQCITNTLALYFFYKM